jgi:peptide chain release factor
VGADERSQQRNRKLALARLARKLEEQKEEVQAGQRRERWKAHQELERGNAVRVYRAG